MDYGGNGCKGGERTKERINTRSFDVRWSGRYGRLRRGFFALDSAPDRSSIIELDGDDDERAPPDDDDPNSKLPELKIAFVDEGKPPRIRVSFSTISPRSHLISISSSRTLLSKISDLAVISLAVFSRICSRNRFLCRKRADAAVLRLRLSSSAAKRWAA